MRGSRGVSVPITLTGSLDSLLPLAGVVLGGLLAGGTAYFLERARERRAARAAALLVRDEMKQIWTTLDISVANFGGIVIGAEEWDTSQWHAHRNTLAAGLAPAVWGSVADAYRGLRFVHTRAQKAALSEGRKKPFRRCVPGGNPLRRPDCGRWGAPRGAANLWKGNQSA
jgi:hypothetical protein